LNTRYIFITGGVVSSLGKGITSASIGCVLSRCGLRVNLIKMDPYLNVDPGRMDPFEHGEVFVTSDGAEADLDLGHYERFLGRDMTGESSLTSGRIYSSVIARERRGGYGGHTVQVIPHITDEIKSRILSFSRRSDVVIVEIGGTVGDIESLPFLEAIRQIRTDVGRDRAAYIHLTLLPYVDSAGEVKTKPTQQSVAKLREIGIQPDMVMTRSPRPLSPEARQKISLFCNVRKDHVIHQRDVKATVYEVPVHLRRQGVDTKLFRLLSMRRRRADMKSWEDMLQGMLGASSPVRVGISGECAGAGDSCLSISEALKHAQSALGVMVDPVFIDLDNKNPEEVIPGLDGLIIAGESGGRTGKNRSGAVRICRETDKPFFGICLGFKTMLDEFGSNVMKKKLPFRLDTSSGRGSLTVRVKKGSLAAKSYAAPMAAPRRRRRLRVDEKVLNSWSRKGVEVTGVDRSDGLTEIIELKGRRWFLSCQFHPEYTSRPTSPERLFLGFVSACADYSREKNL